MARRRTHAPLNVLINARRVGELDKQSSGAINFVYDDQWLEWDYRFPVSLSLPLRRDAFRGATVDAVFDNLLPDNDDIRRTVAERTGAQGSDVYSLLEQIGRDCVGALQFIPYGYNADPTLQVTGTPISDREIEAILNNLGRAPLGIDTDEEFRISVAGAQEKTALLRMDNMWFRPEGTTPTTHILKPQLGHIPTASGIIDLSNSVDNEHYCLTLMGQLGLKVAKTEIATFGDRKVLVVERFDRQWRGERILRLPQEDLCQALGFPASRKYESAGGPGAVQILKLLEQADDAKADQIAFFKSLVIFWLIGATDGHAKNYSLFLRPNNSLSLTPFYDVLSAQPAVDARAIPHGKFKLAMKVGNNGKYKIGDINGRHFIETAKAAGLGVDLARQAIGEIRDDLEAAFDKTLPLMPEGFDRSIHGSVRKAAVYRRDLLRYAFEDRTPQ